MRGYGGIFLISMASLVLEITLTRVFSVTLGYHYAFLVISIAMLGLGGGGALLALRPSLLQGDASVLLTRLSLLFSFGVLLSLATLAYLPIEAFQGDRIALLLLAYFLAAGLPFFSLGAYLAAFFSRYPERAGTIYCFDLAGAGAGCLLALWALSALGGLGSLLFAAAAGALVGLFSVRSLKSMVPFLLLATSLFLLAPRADRLIPLSLSPQKALASWLEERRYPEARLLYTRWDAFSRMDVFENPQAPLIWSLSPNFQGWLPPQKGMTLDADALSPIIRYRGIEELTFLEHMPFTLPYIFTPRSKVLVIGPGGGIDLLLALRYGAGEIIGVEVNPLVIEVMRGRFRDFSGGIYEHPAVHIELEEGRSFLRRSAESYDVIQLTVVDTWAALMAGAYSLSENYLYTVEAFQDYLRHLTPEGMLVISRWYTSPPREALRTAYLAIAALEREGVRQPASHIVMLRNQDFFTLGVKRGELSQAELETITSFAQRNAFEILYAPGFKGENEFHALLRPTGSGAQALSYSYKVGPVTDDSPFFFDYYEWGSLLGEGGQELPLGHRMLLVATVLALLLSSLFVLGPLLHRQGWAMGHYWGHLAYFVSLGLGYMFLEIALMQRFTLFLGRPVLSLSVTLFGLLLSSGLGSLASQRLFAAVALSQLWKVILALAGLSLVYVFLLPPLFQVALGQGLAVRILLSLLLLLPLGFLMGMPFPLGLRLLAPQHHPMVPWAWGTNAAASVLGSVLYVYIALSWGFSAVMVVAAALYLGGMLLLTFAERGPQFGMA